jgi:hypothetical protein
MWRRLKGGSRTAQGNALGMSEPEIGVALKGHGRGPDIVKREAIRRGTPLTTGKAWGSHGCIRL